MSRLISRAEGFESAYEAFQQVNFSAFDYNTIKESMLDYIKLYFPENFNDYIESSEFIAILELFAYLGEILSYRIDINAHENFITTAQRKQNILRLAKLISYNPSRNIPARGLVKITSVSCTESVIDSDGVDLINRTIIWNDPNNPKWKEQFILVINKILAQNFGSVVPKDRVQVDDVLFELYKLNNIPETMLRGVAPYSVTVSGETLPMELVPVELDSNGPKERRPNVEETFSILYGSDGLGDSSDTTGFFMFTKQGILQSQDAIFDGITPNQTWSINVDNINEVDVWLNNIEPDTGKTLEEWERVDIAHAQNIIFNTNTNRKKFELESLEDDHIRTIFGDGEFSDVPSGTFKMWFRTSVNSDVVIPRNTVNNADVAFTYLDSDSNNQTCTMTYSLINTLQNSSASEDIEHIRRTAPAVYYSQDRMVNARDYNTFMLQDPSIVKLRAVNRTFAGESKYITWNDPSDVYRNVKQFGDDMVLYYEVFDEIDQALNVDEDTLIRSTIEPLLLELDVFLTIALLDPHKNARQFTQIEYNSIYSVLNPAPSILPIGSVVYITHGDYGNRWFDAIVDDGVTPKPHNTIFTVEKTDDFSWIVTTTKTQMIVDSQDTNFWHTNNGDVTLTYDSLLTNSDKVVVLKANTDSSGSVLANNISFEALSRITLPSGLDSLHQLKVIPVDGDENGIPDNVTLTGFLNKEYVINSDGLQSEVTLPVSFIAGDEYGDIISVVDESTGAPIDIIPGIPGEIVDTIARSVGTFPAQIRVTMRDFVYFYRETTSSEWVPLEGNASDKASFAADVDVSVGGTLNGDYSGVGNNYKRYRGRGKLNFLWTHFSTRYNLIDPSTSNIIDMFIIPKAYYSNYRAWLEGVSTIQPESPTPFSLRNDYSALLDNKMISDTVVLNPGKFKVLFGADAISELKAKFVVIRSVNGKLTDNQVKLRMISTIKQFFDITQWEFGETFYFTELGSAIQHDLAGEIDSVVLVPLQTSNVFGDLFQVYAREDEIFLPSISVDDIEIVDSFNATNLKQMR